MTDHEEEPIAHLYSLASALRHVATSLPEDEDGLMRLLLLISDDVQACTVQLDDADV